MKDKLIEVLKAVVIIFLFFSSKYIKAILAFVLRINVSDLSNQDYVVLTFLTDIILMIIFYFIYRKDLKREFKKFKKDFGANMDSGLKYWILGLMIMIISNFLIAMFTPLNNSTNESTVQSLIPAAPFLMFIVAGVFAPIIEEITFRKTFKNVFKNKWVFATISFLVFGFIHTSVGSNPLELLYIIPYGALGFTFALAYYETDTVFTSMSMHALHNSLLILLSLIKL